MNIKLNNIASYSHQGKRAYQEDNFIKGTNFLLVSDGVGGSAKGNIASKIVTEHWANAIIEEKIKLDNYLADVQNEVDSCIQKMNQYAHKNPESIGMGATLALLLQIENKFLSIHIGDSRIYHFSKDGKIKWRSKDHSLVQELVTAGLITDEETHNHPQKNKITRALIAKPDHKTQAAVTELNDLEDGDTFLVCSDGVLESWEDKVLTAYVKNKQDNNKLIHEIENLCAESSSDNNTAIVANVEVLEAKQQESVPVSVIEEQDANDEEDGVIIIDESSNENAIVDEILVAKDASNVSMDQSSEPTDEGDPDQASEKEDENDKKEKEGDGGTSEDKKNKDKKPKSWLSKLLKYFIKL